MDVSFVDGNNKPQNQCVGEDDAFQIRGPHRQGIYLLISWRCSQDMSIFTQSIASEGWLLGWLCCCISLWSRNLSL